jgi:hypothetical protein
MRPEKTSSRFSLLQNTRQVEHTVNATVMPRGQDVVMRRLTEQHFHKMSPADNILLREAFILGRNGRA